MPSWREGLEGSLTGQLHQVALRNLTEERLLDLGGRPCDECRPNHATRTKGGGGLWVTPLSSLPGNQVMGDRLPFLDVLDHRSALTLYQTDLGAGQTEPDNL